MSKLLVFKVKPRISNNVAKARAPSGARGLAMVAVLLRVDLVHRADSVRVLAMVV